MAECIKSERREALKQFENPDSHRLISGGQILTPDTKMLSEFAGLRTGNSIHLVKKPDQAERQPQRSSPYDRPTNNQVDKC